uniref:Uncharacterized protein n=1 Tax=Oryza barthii TaxID=65489 RepID=A0A679BCR6_9ORYZ|nr:hypothetical protein [Oryza barthii]
MKIRHGGKARREEEARPEIGRPTTREAFRRAAGTGSERGPRGFHPPARMCEGRRDGGMGGTAWARPTRQAAAAARWGGIVGRGTDGGGGRRGRRQHGGDGGPAAMALWEEMRGNEWEVETLRGGSGFIGEEERTRVERLGHALQSSRQAAGPSGSAAQALTVAATGRSATTGACAGTKGGGGNRRRGERKQRERQRERAALSLGSGTTLVLSTCEGEGETG